MTLGKVTLILDDDVLQKLQVLAEEFWGEGAEVERFLSYLGDAAEVTTVRHTFAIDRWMTRLTLDDYLFAREKNNES